MSTYQELKAQAEELIRQAEEARKMEVTAVVTAIRAKMEEYGLTPEDLFPNLKFSKRRAKSEAKYRDPVTGKTWTGHGRKPAWLEQALAQGRSIEEFRI